VYSSLKSFLKFLLPKFLLLKAEPFLRKIVSAFFIGSKYQCPICRFHARKFIQVHEGASHLCPRCGSIERKRLLWLYLRDEIKIQKQNNFRALHFSPSSVLFRKLMVMENVEYTPTSFDNPLIKNHFDITSLPFGENRFDIIICYHVFEHIDNDKKAMSELFRVLKKSGVALLQVPYSEKETIEDSSVTNPEERKKLFGQEDHVRYYGRTDFKKRLENAGFNVEEISYAKKLGEEKSELYQLNRDEIIFRCLKA